MIKVKTDMTKEMAMRSGAGETPSVYERFSRHEITPEEAAAEMGVTVEEFLEDHYMYELTKDSRLRLQN